MFLRNKSIKEGEKMKKIMLSFIFFVALTSSLDAVSNIYTATIDKVRIWKSGEMYIVASSTQLMNPASCSNSSFLEINNDSDPVAKSYIVALAIEAKKDSKTVLLGIDKDVCEGNYPRVNMIELQ